MSDGMAIPALPQTPPRAKAAQNVFWLVAERTIKAAGGVVMGVLIARHLGPNEYGRYGAAIGLSTLAKDAVMLGFDRMIRRDIATHPEKAGKYLGTSIALSLTLAFAVALGLSALSGHMVDDAETRRLTLIVLWMALPQAFFSCEIWFESSGQTRPLVWTRNAVWSTALVGRLVLLAVNAGVLAFAIIALIEWAATYAAVFLLLRRLHGRELSYSFDLNQLRAWLREGWPFVLMVIMASSADRTMVLFVHNFAATDAEAGYLNAALRITEVWWAISTIVAAVLLPRIVAIQKTDPTRYARAAQSYANASLLVGLGAALAVSASAPFLIPRLFGAVYAPSALVLVILFWSGPVVYPSVARSQFFVSRGLAILDLPTVACIAALQVTLALHLVPRYGAIGAAISITSAQWLGFYGMTLLLPRLRRASRAQFAAFAALRAPVETFRNLSSFVGGMIRKS
jgi:O-antigen/teichoic acid export membrane protein